MNANPTMLEGSIVSLYSFRNAVLDAQYWRGSVYDLQITRGGKAHKLVRR